ncbi:50S ribosomal protein L23 [Candidatus Bathyarchaeota archaeon]|nr:50S ribosomal protein L23 [Candidatus Bathyarchaeota archaeon]MBS7629896.1 50S ribosomal protein L23 [Candidatus Bathyarchaeota archaeon]
MSKTKLHEVIQYPLISEETVAMIERENKITFIVNPAADKRDVKRAVEELYEAEVESVNTLITPDGRKKAYVKFKPEYKAADLAVKLGIL